MIFFTWLKIIYDYTLVLLASVLLLWCCFTIVSSHIRFGCHYVFVCFCCCLCVLFILSKTDSIYLVHVFMQCKRHNKIVWNYCAFDCSDIFFFFVVGFWSNYRQRTAPIKPIWDGLAAGKVGFSLRRKKNGDMTEIDKTISNTQAISLETIHFKWLTDLRDDTVIFLSLKFHFAIYLVLNSPKRKDEGVLIIEPNALFHYAISMPPLPGWLWATFSAYFLEAGELNGNIPNAFSTLISNETTESSNERTKEKHENTTERQAIITNLVRIANPDK